jgi:hypothetical protein
VTIPATQPPQTPWVVYSTVNASNPAAWDLARSNGTAIKTASINPIVDVADFMRTASADLSTLVIIHSPSGNPLVTAQLGDLAH